MSSGDDDDLPLAQIPTLAPPHPEWDRDLPAHLDPFARPPRRRTIAISGSGAALSAETLTVNLGVYLAQLGRSVVLCDLAPFATSLHTTAGLERTATALAADFAAGKVAPVPCPVPGLSVLPVPVDVYSMSPSRVVRRSRLYERLHNLEADYILWHLGEGASTTSIDLSRRADLLVHVGCPLPSGIDGTYRWLRALYARELSFALRTEPNASAVFERVARELPPDATPLEVSARMARYDDLAGGIALDAMGRLNPRFVVSDCRTRSDVELGPAMAELSQRFLGLRLDALGHIEWDEAIWLAAKKRAPLLVDNPASRAARSVERIARRVLSVFASREHRGVASIAPAPQPNPERTLYEVLGTPPSSSDEELRRAVRRQRAMFSDSSLAAVSLISGEDRKEELRRIDEAQATLLDGPARAAYDAERFGSRALRPSSRPRETNDAERILLQAELASELGPDTPFTGPLLRKIRLAQGIELEDIGLQTKIHVGHLSAIEKENFRDLPAAVYVQGFVGELAKALKLDPKKVTRSYMGRLRSHLDG